MKRALLIVGLALLLTTPTSAHLGEPEGAPEPNGSIALPPPPFGAEEAAAIPSSQEAVLDFDSTVELGRDGSATITEEITYQTGARDRHGIFRTIPLTLKGIPRLGFQLLSVTDDQGRAQPYDRNETWTEVTVKIGHAHSTFRGTRTYQIRYRLWPLVHDNGLFAYNVTGTSWAIPIARASVLIKAPATGADPRCFTGSANSTAADCVIQSTTDSLGFETQDTLPPHAGLTVQANYSAIFSGSLEKSAPGWPALPWLDYTGFLVALLIAKLALLRYLWTIWHRRRLRKSQTIIPQYEAPSGLTPAELGVLEDDQGGISEVTATLIDLAVGGYLKISQVRPPRLWRKAEYELTKLKDVPASPDYVAQLFGALFKDGDTIQISKVDKEATSEAVSNLRSEAKKRLVTKKYYSAQAPSPLLRKLILPGLILIVLLAIYLKWGRHLDTALVGWQLAFIIAAGVGLWLVRRIKVLTPLGAGEWAHVEGFRWFLSVTERDRLKFTDAPDKTPELFSALLPAAIALGVEREWAKQFQGIDVSPSVSGWYVGSNYNSLALASDFGSMNSSVGSGFSAPSSSGGGGGVGGGGGGGGGGGW